MNVAKESYDDALRLMWGEVMTIWLWLQFVLAISLLIVIPGPSATLVIQYSKCPPSVFLTTILGGNLASLILLLLAAWGLSILAEPKVLLVLQLGGGAYLFYVGVTTFKSQGLMRDAAPRKQVSSAFSRALWVGLSNPKDILFFASFLSLFLLPNDPRPMATLLILIATWTVVDWLVMLGYVGVFRKQTLLHTTGLNRLCGALLVGISLMLLYSVATTLSSG